MATNFDALISGGGANPMMGAAAMFAGIRERNDALTVQRQGQAQDMLQFMMASSADERKDRAAERQFTAQRDLVSRQLAAQEEDSAFGRLNKSLETQLKIAESESAMRDKAFQGTMQTELFKIQTQKMVMELKEATEKQLAVPLAQRAELASFDLQQALLTGDIKKATELQAELASVRSAPGAGYIAQMNPAAYQTMVSTSMAAGQALSRVAKLDPTHLGGEHTLLELPNAAEDMAGGRRVDPASLNLLAQLKQTALSNDGKVDVGDLEGMKLMVSKSFGASPQQADRIVKKLFAEGNVERTLAAIAAAPDAPLSGEAAMDWAVNEQHREEIRQDINSRPGLSRGMRDKLIRHANQEALTDFFTQSGSAAPEVPVARAQTMSEGQLSLKLFEARARAASRPGEAAVSFAAEEVNRFNIVSYVPVAPGSAEYLSAAADGRLLAGVLEGNKFRPRTSIASEEVRDGVTMLLNKQAELQSAFSARGGSSAIQVDPIALLQGLDASFQTAVQSVTRGLPNPPDESQLGAYSLALRDIIPPGVVNHIDLISEVLTDRGITPRSPEFIGEFNALRRMDVSQLLDAIAGPRAQLMPQQSAAAQNGSPGLPGQAAPWQTPGVGRLPAPQ